MVLLNDITRALLYILNNYNASITLMDLEINQSTVEAMIDMGLITVKYTDTYRQNTCRETECTFSHPTRYKLLPGAAIWLKR
jgi:hypothetical protein